jgi:hypothetical protein
VEWELVRKTEILIGNFSSYFASYPIKWELHYLWLASQGIAIKVIMSHVYIWIDCSCFGTFRRPGAHLPRFLCCMFCIPVYHVISPPPSSSCSSIFCQLGPDDRSETPSPWVTNRHRGRRKFGFKSAFKILFWSLVSTVRGCDHLAEER